jgi:hypothetical protein
VTAAGGVYDPPAGPPAGLRGAGAAEPHLRGAWTHSLRSLWRSTQKNDPRDYHLSPSPREAGRGVRSSSWGAAMVAALILAFARPALAQDPRPTESDMFGGGEEAKAPAEPKAEAKPSVPAAAAAAPPASEAPASGGGRDDALLGHPDAGPQLSTEAAPDNPLTIGGQLYLRTQSSALEHTYPDRWTLASPNLLDTYFDARPNDRVRAFIRGRVSFDPTAAPASTSTTSAVNQNATASGGALGGTGFTTFNPARGPNAVLDQMWIAFDIEHKVFVTAGKQHVKWGTGRFWTPTDYLHPVKRNPLDVFDARPGTTMVKLHFPWESRAWNFYAFGVIEDPNAASNTLRQVAGAARAELVEGPAELGLDVLVKRDQQPRAGVDLSIGIDDFDFYTDIGLRAGSEIPIVRAVDPAALDPMCASDLSRQYHVGRASGIKPQAVGGVTWSRKYNDNDVLTVGGEYFYNSVGYADPSVYPGLLFNDSGTPLLNFFYTGRHYAAVFASLPAPYSWNYTTFTLSTIGNLSDQTFVTRLDYSVTLLTHLTFEAFVAGHYGNRGGEFRLGFDVAQQTICDVNGMPTGAVIPPIHVNAALVDLGVALRLKI